MLIIVRGAGDIATGTIHRLHRCGFKVMALESKSPSSIRREVSFSEAIYEGVTLVEGVVGRRVTNYEEIKRAFEYGEVPIMEDAHGIWIDKLKPEVVVDAILAKINVGTNRNMAEITIGLGPGFVAGRDVDAVIETMRGHNLGKIIYSGKAQANTGVPGTIGGFSKERVIYSEYSGIFQGDRRIGDIVSKGEVIGNIGDKEIVSTIDGVLRGIIRDGHVVKKGLKIADIDPRLEEVNNCYTISDKARAIGGSVLEVILSIMTSRGKDFGKEYIREINWGN
ncbi:selenium-dependent molybdenum cofactor biosynthesis protein YqeB [Cetobacterium sp. SF1]|uniref:selenium-dependent molybdenum cofactor biosynthesis protein YqeB n=1 Tax=unclassified Cetobacterium TaxID=2630983 RepID=UPI003CF7A21D